MPLKVKLAIGILVLMGLSLVTFFTISAPAQALITLIVFLVVVSFVWAANIVMSYYDEKAKEIKPSKDNWGL